MANYHVSGHSQLEHSLFVLFTLSVIPKLVVLYQSAGQCLRTTGLGTYIISYDIMSTALLLYANGHIRSFQV